MTATSQHDLLGRYRLAFAVANDGLQQLVRNLSVEPHWIDGCDAFWYRRETERGHEFVRVDPEQGTSKPAFDHSQLAALLAAVTGENVSATALPFERFAYDLLGPDRPGEAAIRFEVRGITWACDLAAGRCIPTSDELEPIFPTAGPDAEFSGRLWGATVPSPDGRYRATRRDHNLSLETVATGEVRALTTDGTRRHGYAEMSGTIWDGDVSMPRFGKEWPAQVRWSPDSR